MIPWESYPGDRRPGPSPEVVAGNRNQFSPMTRAEPLGDQSTLVLPRDKHAIPIPANIGGSSGPGKKGTNMQQGERLRITFAHDREGIQVHLWAGTGKGSARSRLDVAALRADFEDDLTPSPEALKTRTDTRVRELGGRLFEHLFCPHTGGRSLFDKAVERHRQGAEPLRLELDFELGDSELQWLQSIPWEMCYSATHRCFLSQSRDFSIVRTLRSPLPSTPLRGDRPSRCLIAWSSPDAPGRGPALALEAETEAVVEVLEAAGVGHETLPHASLSLLREALIDGDFGILHLAGHGYRESDDDRRLRFGVILEDPLGGEDRVDSEDLGKWLADTGIGLVVLNTCWSARESSHRSPGAFHGVAQRLIRLGVPAVLAMQLPILDTAATLFGSHFYRRLLRGDSIEAALTETRMALSRQGTWRQQWMVPLLFLHSPGHDVLFEESSPSRHRRAGGGPPLPAPSDVRVRVKDLEGHGAKVYGRNIEISGTLAAGFGRPTIDVEVEGARSQGIEIIGEKLHINEQPTSKES